MWNRSSVRVFIVIAVATTTFVASALAADAKTSRLHLSRSGLQIRCQNAGGSYMEWEDKSGGLCVTAKSDTYCDYNSKDSKNCVRNSSRVIEPVLGGIKELVDRASELSPDSNPLGDADGVHTIARGKTSSVKFHRDRADFKAQCGNTEGAVYTQGSSGIDMCASSKSVTTCDYRANAPHNNCVKIRGKPVISFAQMVRALIDNVATLEAAGTDGGPSGGAGMTSTTTEPSTTTTTSPSEPSTTTTSTTQPPVFL